MAFNKENFYAEGNSQEFFFTRTNPLANPANAEILKIEKSGCCGTELPLVAEYEYNGMGQTFDIDFSSPTSAIDSRYVKVVVTDGQGNFATAVGTGTVWRERRCVRGTPDLGRTCAERQAAAGTAE
jgi:hypothetical protein